MRSQFAPVDMDDRTGFSGPWTKFLDDGRVVAVWDKADVLAVGLVGHGQAVCACEFARLLLGSQVAKRKAQELELFRRRREQKVALIPCQIRGHVQFRSAFAQLPLDVMSSGHAIRVDVMCGFKEILEFHTFVAANARHRGGAGKVALGKLVDHGLSKDAFVVEDIVGKPHRFRHPAGITDVRSRTTGALLCQGGSVIIELKRDAHDIIALARKFGGHDGTVHAAGHGHDDTGFRRRLRKAKRVQVFGSVKRHGVTVKEMSCEIQENRSH